ncbi:MAG: hypothetical protein HUU20_14210 [Pirellulales bacterium]|nr:hypothetical protein [Pirellulales bacterium]
MKSKVVAGRFPAADSSRSDQDLVPAYTFDRFARWFAGVERTKLLVMWFHR